MTDERARAGPRRRRARSSRPGRAPSGSPSPPTGIGLAGVGRGPRPACPASTVTSGRSTWAPSYTFGSERISVEAWRRPRSRRRRAGRRRRGGRRDLHALAVVGRVGDDDRRGVVLVLDAVDGDPVAPGLVGRAASGPRRRGTAASVGSQAPGPRSRRRARRRRRRPSRRPMRGSCAGQGARRAGRPGARSPVEQQRRLAGRVVGQPEHPGEVVAAAGRHDARACRRRGRPAPASEDSIPSPPTDTTTSPRSTASATRSRIACGPGE